MRLATLLAPPLRHRCPTRMEGGCAGESRNIESALWHMKVGMTGNNGERGGGEFHTRSDVYVSWWWRSSMF